VGASNGGLVGWICTIPCHHCHLGYRVWVVRNKHDSTVLGRVKVWCNSAGLCGYAYDNRVMQGNLRGLGITCGPASVLHIPSRLPLSPRIREAYMLRGSNRDDAYICLGSKAV
jgi:hypothetical protein